MSRPARTPATTTLTRILDVAERLVQAQGFNGFSYADIAVRVKVQKPSLHHHFRTKADLGNALVERYHRTFFLALQSIEGGGGSEAQRLEAYVDLYRQVLTRKRMCLCGMLAAESATLPTSMRRRVEQFFEANEQWLMGLLEAGRRAKLLRFDGDPRAAAQHAVCTLEGAMLIARTHGGLALFDSVAAGLLRELSVPSA